MAFFRIFSVFLLSLSVGVTAFFEDVYAAPVNYTSVLKIRSYVYDSVTHSYTTYAEGSAVVMGPKKIITNAHVILGANDTPTGYYEVCRTISYSSAPQCFMVAKLVSYDTEADLALLEPSIALASGLAVGISGAKITLGSTVNIYGYPGIGGDTITSTSGKIAGFEDNVYKLDATIDHGNSGGGAFDSVGKLIGIPFAIRSDNGVIGYMIPSSTVSRFLSRKTADIQSYDLDVSDFSRYIAAQKKVATTQKVLAPGITIASPKKYGFSVVGGSVSQDAKLTLSYLVSTDKRVYVGYSCNQIYGDKTLADVQETSVSQYAGTSESEMTSRHIGADAGYLEVSMNPTDTTKKGGLWYYYPRGYSNCLATISATNRTSDAKNIEKARQLITSGTLWKIGEKNMTFSDPILSKSPITLPVAFRVHKIMQSDGSISFAFWYIQGSGYTSAGDLKVQSMQTLRNFFTAMDPNFTSSDMSFAAFERVYAKNNAENMKDTTYTTKTGQRFILSIETTGDKKMLSMVYPFRTSDGAYKVLSLTDLELTDADDTDIAAIANFFTTFDFPGVSAFQK